MPLSPEMIPTCEKKCRRLRQNVIDWTLSIVSGPKLPCMVICGLSQVEFMCVRVWCCLEWRSKDWSPRRCWWIWFPWIWEYRAGCGRLQGQPTLWWALRLVQEKEAGLVSEKENPIGEFQVLHPGRIALVWPNSVCNYQTIAPGTKRTFTKQKSRSVCYIWNPSVIIINWSRYFYKSEI